MLNEPNEFVMNVNPSKEMGDCIRQKKPPTSTRGVEPTTSGTGFKLKETIMIKKRIKQNDKRAKHPVDYVTCASHRPRVHSYLINGRSYFLMDTRSFSVDYS